MLIERPPEIYRALFPGAVWRIPNGKSRRVYLTFDDGPVPEVTPWVLRHLDDYGIKATFFMVGDNVRKHPRLLEEVIARGHSVGNHTMHHLQGIKTGTEQYLADISEASKLIESPLFRPPHGMLRRGQLRRLSEEFRIIMYDVVTRDYSKHLSSDDVFANVKRNVRPGSIIVFHDSLKSFPRLKVALPQTIEWLFSRGYGFEAIPME